MKGFLLPAILELKQINQVSVMGRKKLCTYPKCKVIIDYYGDARCPEHATTSKPKKRVLEHHYIDGKYIYHTSMWRRLSKQKRQDNPYCEHCAKNKRATIAQMVDHIVPIEFGGAPFNIDNLQSLCHRCHAIKTAADNRKYK